MKRQKREVVLVGGPATGDTSKVHPKTKTLKVPELTSEGTIYHKYVVGETYAIYTYNHQNG